MPRTTQQFEEIRKRTKSKILENALVLFAEKGFKGTSISEIAKAAKVSKGLAYNYFRNKNELMFSVLELLSKEIESIFLNAKNLKDPHDKLRLLINETLKQLNLNEKFWRLYMNFVLSAEIQSNANKFLAKFLDNAFSELENIFIELKHPNPSLESKTFGAILDGVCFHFLFDRENYPLEKMRKYLISKYCN